MTAKTDAMARIGDVLGDAHLTTMVYQSASATRLDGDDNEDSKLPVNVQMSFQRMAEDQLFFKFDVGTARPDLEASVGVVVGYTVPRSDLWDDDYVTAVFAERIAFPAAYPFARAKLFQMTVDFGVRPVVLDVVAMGAQNVFVPDERTDGQPIYSPSESQQVDA